MNSESNRGFFRTVARVGVIRLFVMGFLLVLGLGLLMAFHMEYGQKHLAPAFDTAATLMLCGVLAGLYALLVRLFEGRWPRELALKSGAGLAGLGVLIGFGLFCSVYAILTILGVVSWGGFRGFAGTEEMVVMAAIAGVGEELLFRGVLFRVVEDSLGTTISLIVSAVLFGLMHSASPGAFSVNVNTVAIALEAGLMLAAAYAWSRNLWLPIGIHFAWNFTEGGVFGAVVSGEHANGIFTANFSKSASTLITGGAFGPEASVVTVIVCLALATVFLIATWRAGRWRKLTFRVMLDRGAV
jgi:membrane protease YdiL (CAAX protease family)